MSVVSSETKNIDGKIISLEKKQEQEDLREKISALMDYLKVEKNDIKSVIINNRIKQLSKDIDETLLVNFNIKAMLEEVNEQRKNLNKLPRRY
jgi:chromosome segregation ATPase